MHPIMKKYRGGIESYCIANGLSAARVFASAQSGNPDAVTLYQRPVFSNAEKIVIDNNPLPVVLKIYLENGELRFEQTDITRKYLGIENDVAPVPKMPPPVRPSLRSRPEPAYA